MVIVDALQDKDAVGNTEVNGQCDDGGDKTGPKSSNKVRNVAQEPDGEKYQGNAVCRL